MPILKGQILSVTATVQEVSFADNTISYSLVNDGASTVYFRSILPGTTFQGDDTALKALDAALLKSGESVAIKAGRTVVVVCATGQTATVRVLPGEVTVGATLIGANVDVGDVGLVNIAGTDINPATSDLQTTGNALLTTIDGDTGNIATAVQKATTQTTSTIYDGGGAGNDLVKYTTNATLIAAVGGMTVINTSGYNTLVVYLANSVTAQTGKLLVTEYSAATPTVATLTKQIPATIPTEDTATVDRVIFGLATGVEIYSHSSIAIAVRPGSYILLSLDADLAGGLWYARYELHGSV